VAFVEMWPDTIAQNIAELDTLIAGLEADGKAERAAGFRELRRLEQKEHQRLLREPPLEEP
jgi:hypothetical protein